MSGLGDRAAPALALARVTDVLLPVGVRDPRWEPKYDGWRAAWAGGRLWSRHGRDLTRYFPDLVPALTAQLPAGVVLDGEVVAFDSARGRLDFAALGRRLTAGRQLASVARARPAQLVAFDVLAADGQDLRGLGLAERRRRLEQLLAGASPPLALAEHTDDKQTALRWLQELGVTGVEGLVVKDAGGRYPTTAGQRVWHKLKTRRSVDLIAVGVLGDPADPIALQLAVGGLAGSLTPVGTTSRLTRAAARDVGRLVRPTGQTRTSWGGLPGTGQGPSEVSVIEPFVVEVAVDEAIDLGTAGPVLRHGARFLRARPDLDPRELDGQLP